PLSARLLRIDRDRASAAPALELGDPFLERRHTVPQCLELPPRHEIEPLAGLFECALRPVHGAADRLLRPLARPVAAFPYLFDRFLDRFLEGREDPRRRADPLPRRLACLLPVVLHLGLPRSGFPGVQALDPRT